MVVEPEEVAAYDEVMVAKSNAAHAVTFLKFLVAGKDSENPVLRDRQALRLRRAYLNVVIGWRMHEDRYHRGIVVPEWNTLAEVPPEGDGRELMKWSMARWKREYVAELKFVVALHFAVATARRVGPDRPRRSEVKAMNSIGQQLGKELDYVTWAVSDG